MSTSPSAEAGKAIAPAHVFSVLSLVALAVVAKLGGASHFWTAVAMAILALSVATAVHHAEAIAAKVGPSLGALVLALAVTIIEVGLIVSMMMNDSADSAVVARDTVFAAVIIVTNGILGVCLLVGGMRYREVGFHAGGTNSLLAALAVLSGLTLVLPNFTTSAERGMFNTPQLLFASLASLTVYAGLLFAQTKTHKDYFEPVGIEGGGGHGHGSGTHGNAWVSLACLVMSLGAVIGFAKTLSPAIEAGIHAVGAPRATVGIVIALLVLAPETLAAVTAARQNELQTSLNLALGSGAASIALTIPVVSGFVVFTNRPLVLGIDSKNMVFLLLTFVTGSLTLARGTSTALQGMIHLILLSAFLALSFIP